MSDREHNSRRRWGRCAVIGGTLLTFALLLVLRADRRQQRVERLIDEIASSGGSVQMPAPVERRLSAWWKDRFASDRTIVSLSGSRCDGQWLRNNDSLRDLSIRHLSIFDCPLTGSDVTGLVAGHPLEGFLAATVPDTDAIAKALGKKETLRKLNLGRSDLSDAGLRLLPLEQLELLVVSGTQVTPEGLQELRRCKVLNNLTLDGRQFTRKIAELIRACRMPRTLVLTGAHVTDEHLQQLDGLPVEEVHLVDTSVTSDALDAISFPSPQVHDARRELLMPVGPLSPF